MTQKRIQWHLERWEISKLIPYKKNPRIITEDGLKHLKNSFDDIGIAQPVNINTDGTILSGHARTQQLKADGETEVDVYVPDRKLTPKQEEAVIVRMNKNTAGMWDFDILANDFEFDDLIDWGFTPDDFDMPDVEEIGGKTDEDAVPEVQPDPIAKRGDVWLLGNHRLMCGDSTMIDDIEKLMNGEKADMVFTDPPYGVSIKGKFTGGIKNDDLRDDELEDFLLENNFCLRTVCNKAIYICYEILNSTEFFSAYGRPDEVIVWNKDSASFYSDNKWNRKFESILYFANDTKPNVKGDTNVWDFPKSSSFNNRDENNKRFNEKGNSCVAHPTTKPFLLPMKAVEASSKPKDIVLDTFLGSGATLIACEKANRRCRGMELDEKYCDVIIKRWQEYTGKEATLETTGETYNSMVVTDGK